jgi:dTDP-4-dehydrorhamnose 3,5-epimerase
MADAQLIELQVFADDRGSFSETYNSAKFAALGITHEFVQDNESLSTGAGTVRGLHLQLPPYAQGKLVRAMQGSILDVAVDLRPNSPTYLQHATVTLRGEDQLVFWIPPGFAHGFCTLEPGTVVAYKTTALYAPDADRSIRFDDPRLGIDWPVDATAAILSDKDAAAPPLGEIEHEL